MQSPDTTQILDFENYRRQREQISAQPQQQAQIPEGFTPALMWYPIWVLVPNTTPVNPAS